MTTAAHLQALTSAVLFNLENQQDWTDLKTHSVPGLARDIITGLPPRRLYTHPDEQVEIIKAEKNRQERIPQQPPEYEWVLPTHMSETWTLATLAAVFDAVQVHPPDAHRGAGHLDDVDDDGNEEWKQWRGSKRGKRITLGIVQDDSTVVYYLVHDGVVKPRPN